jgi:hypothetical protein
VRDVVGEGELKAGEGRGVHALTIKRALPSLGRGLSQQHHAQADSHRHTVVIVRHRVN